MPLRLLGRVVSGLSLCTLLIWEWRKPLRSVHESRLTRDFRNLLVAAAAGIAVQVAEAPVAKALVRATERRRWGITHHLPLPPALRRIAAVLLFDYTLYLWHLCTHRLPLLWRFHQVHHIDREMDSSTAIRFHFGEMLLSVPFRALQILVIGPDGAAFARWQSFLFACILFHHSNARLPLAFERWLARLIVTPRLHGIHHSIRSSEINSNWSSGLTLWDWLHRTLRTDRPQHELTLGVSGRRSHRDIQLPELFVTPFDHPAAVPPGNNVRLRQPLTGLR